MILHTEIVERVRRGARPAYRPKVVHEDPEDDKIVELMEVCWEEIAAFRPNFNTIKGLLKSLSKGRYVCGTL